MLYVPLGARRTLGVLSARDARRAPAFHGARTGSLPRNRARSAIHLDNARLFLQRADAPGGAERASRPRVNSSVMVHELRTTPLTLPSPATPSCELGVRVPVNSQTIEDLRRIRQSQRPWLGLINELLTSRDWMRVGCASHQGHHISAAECVAGTLALIEPQQESMMVCEVVRSTQRSSCART